MSAFIADMLKKEGPVLEFVRAAIAGDDLAKGVDLLRTRPNECSILQGRIQTNQIWQRIVFTSDPPTIERVTLGVGDEVLSLRPGNNRLDHLRLVKPGAVLRALVHEPSVRQLSLASLEIFGWEVLDAWLPEVEEAIRKMGSS